jgi:ferredoxin
MNKAKANRRNTLLKGLSPSTRAFMEEARKVPGFSLLDLLHGYVYLRWPYPYIALINGEHPLIQTIKPILKFTRRIFPAWDGRQKPGRNATDGYHGKVITNESARQLVSVKEDIELKNLEHVIPYPHARDIILMDPDHIVAVECPCRASRENPCLPLDVCLVVGEPFAGFAVAHRPEHSRWISAGEACEILDREHARGRVHHAFFRDVTLDRFFVICNCCTCCCTGMQLYRNGSRALASSGYIGSVAPQDCIGCGDCVEGCPFRAMVLSEGVAQVRRETCMGCGLCVTTCSNGAVSLRRDLTKCAPLEIYALLEAARDDILPAQLCFSS